MLGPGFFLRDALVCALERHKLSDNSFPCLAFQQPVIYR